MAKPDAQTVAQMAATIASGLAANSNVRTLVPIEFAKTAVGLARAIVAEVERTEPEEPTITAERQTPSNVADKIQRDTLDRLNRSTR